MDNDELTDFPVLVAFSVGTDRYLLETKGSVLDEHLDPNWPSMTAAELAQAVWSVLEAKIWLGPIDSPDDVEASLEEYRQEGWHVVDSSSRALVNQKAWIANASDTTGHE
ncbi:MAG: hypothetical protein WD081_03815 [Gammaproteobacteria bacterium]